MTGIHLLLNVLISSSYLLRFARRTWALSPYQGSFFLPNNSQSHHRERFYGINDDFEYSSRLLSIGLVDIIEHVLAILLKFD